MNYKDNLPDYSNKSVYFKESCFNYTTNNIEFYRIRH